MRSVLLRHFCSAFPPALAVRGLRAILDWVVVACNASASWIEPLIGAAKVAMGVKTKFQGSDQSDDLLLGHPGRIHEFH
jgi:hypothetical protein